MGDSTSLPPLYTSVSWQRAAKISLQKLKHRKGNEKLALKNYDSEEWVYEVDLNENGNIYTELEENEIYDLDTVLAPIWEDDEEQYLLY